MYQESEGLGLDLFHTHLDLVFRIVARMHRPSSEHDDLIQAGLMGLYDATKNYDASKGASFATFATYYIVGGIKQEIRNNRQIKLSKAIFRILQRLKNISDNLTLEELCATLDESKEMVLLALNYKENMLSLNQTFDDLEYIDLVKDESLKWDWYLLRDLDKMSQEIILLKYYKGYTQKQIAKMFHLSQSKVSRLEALALSKIRNSL